MNYPTDQSLGSTANNTNFFATNYWRNQTFTPAHTPLTQVSFYLKKIGNPTGNLTIALETDSAGKPSGTVLASATIDATTVTTSFVEYFVRLPYAVTPATKYHITFKGQSAWDGSNDLYMYYATGTGFDAWWYGPGDWTQGGGTTVQQYLKTYYPTISKISGVAVADIKSKNGIAKANILGINNQGLN